MLGYIYKLTLNQDTNSFKKGEIYIGKHDGKKPEYFGSGKLVKGIVKTYGKTVFNREIIAVNLNVQMLCFMEVYYIKLYNCNRSTSKWGLNLTEGGEGLSGYVRTEEHTNKLKQAVIDSYNKGRVGPKSKDVHQYDLSTGGYITTYKKAWDAAEKYKVSSSSISYCARGNLRSVAGFHWSYEKTDKIDILSLYDKSVVQYTLDNQFVKEYINALEAAKSLGCTRSAIRNSCIGLIPTAKGFIWKFKKDTKNV